LLFVSNEMRRTIKDNRIVINRYQLIPRTLAFISHKGKIVFIQKNDKHSLIKGQINGVGGHIEIGEDPYEAVIREIREETGLEVINLQMTAMIFIDTKFNPGILVFVFKADSDGGKLIESNEGRLFLLSRDEVADDKRIMKDVPMLLEICKKHKRGIPPKVIRYHTLNNGDLRID